MAIKNLYKIQKHIIKRKGKGTAIHEKSRDSRRLQRATARDEKLIKAVNARAKANQPHLERIAFFQAASEAKTSPFTLDDVVTLMEEYLNRDEEELSELKTARRQGRPPSKREELLNQRRESEEKEFVAGVWIPDMLDTSNIKSLQDWNQEWVSLQILKFVRITKDGTVKPSSFPPNGMS